MPQIEESVRCVCGEDPPRTASHRRVIIFAIASVAVVSAVVALSAAPGAAPREAVSLLSTGRTARISSLEYFGTQHAMHSTQRHTIYICTPILACTHTYLQTGEQTYFHACTQMDTHSIYTPICTYIDTYIHTYIDIHLHTYTHTYVHACLHTHKTGTHIDAQTHGQTGRHAGVHSCILMQTHT